MLQFILIFPKKGKIIKGTGTRPYRGKSTCAVPPGKRTYGRKETVPQKRTLGVGYSDQAWKQYEIYFILHQCRGRLQFRGVRERLPHKGGPGNN